MSELKPCPFCGGEAEYCGDEEYTKLICNNCGCGTDGYLTSECGAYFAEDQWNARTTDNTITEQDKVISELYKVAQAALELVEEADCFAEGLIGDYENHELVSLGKSLNKFKSEFSELLAKHKQSKGESNA